MPGKAAKVTITERQHDILLTLRDATTAPSHLRQRAAIILLAFDGLRNEDIAERGRSGTTPSRTVATTLGQGVVRPH